MDLLSGTQALMGAVLIVPGIFFILHSKKNGAFVFKAGRSGLEVTGANTGMFLLLMGVILLFLCRFNYEKGIQLNETVAEKNNLAEELSVTTTKIDSMDQVYQKTLDLAFQQKAVMPDIKGLSQEDAMALIIQRGLAVGRVDTVNTEGAVATVKSREYPDTGAVTSGQQSGDSLPAAPGSVIGQKIKAGQVIGLKTRIAFKVAGGD